LSIKGLNYRRNMASFDRGHASVGDQTRGEEICRTKAKPGKEGSWICSTASDKGPTRGKRRQR